MSILIVDDLPSNRLLLTTILEDAGYTDLLTAESASEAFKYLGIDDPTDIVKRIDLILMDIGMPGIDGIEACRQIKSTKHLRDIPIIMITAKTETRDLEAAFTAGATDYITKPVNAVELLARVELALSLKRELDCRSSREELMEVVRQLEEVNQKLLYLSSLDGLTGIANRRSFDESLDREWRRGIRYNTSLSLIMIDVDFFKAYNDTYGHQAGDDCLKQVAGALRSVVRRPGDLVARYGGEEFVVILPGTHLEGALVVAEALRVAVETLKIHHAGSELSRQITISLGVATTVPSRGSSPAALVAAADQALYKAKQEGRNRVKISEVSKWD